MEEYRRAYWRTAVDYYAAAAAETSYQHIRVSPDVFDQLPDNMKAILSSMGAAPGALTTVLSPTQSRTHYLPLATRIDRYRRWYQQRLRDIYKTGAVASLFQSQQRQVQLYHEQHVEAARSGHAPGMAIDRWCRQVISTLSASHRGWRGLMAEAREQANRITRRYWLSTAGLIHLVPPRYRDDEIASLKRAASLSNLYYTGEVVKWYGLGWVAVITDRERTFMAADRLHEAAASREWERLCNIREPELDLEWWLWRAGDWPEFSRSN